MIDHIRAAGQRLAGKVVRTPLLTFPALSAQLGGQIYIKPENLQTTGSFKYRGGLNHLLQLTQEEAEQGVIAYSSGNHAQGVAKAAQDAGVRATLIMPADAPAVKIARTKAFGAEVILYDRANERREDVAAKIMSGSRAKLIPPYDHVQTIAGQGTIGLEVAEQLGGAPLDQALICCGGGGLATGTASALRETYPQLQAFTAEPHNFDDFARSLSAGSLQTNAALTGSICDAIITPTPGHITFALAADLNMRGVSVSDEEALYAVAYAAQKLRLIVEPGGAVALAAALFGEIELAGKSTLIILSGGNIDTPLLNQALALDLPSHWR